MLGTTDRLTRGWYVYILRYRELNISIVRILFLNRPIQNWDLRSSGMLRSTDWYLVTDVSGQPIGAIFKGQEVQDEIQNFQIHSTDTPRLVFLLNKYLVVVLTALARTNSAVLYNV
jgi:hypothetical protein